MISLTRQHHNVANYLENGHVSVHIIFRVAIHAHTAERRIEFERTGTGARAEDELWWGLAG